MSNFSNETRSKHNSDNDVVIVSALRTPMCRARKGGLANILPSTLFEKVMQATVERSGIRGADIEDICVGNVLMPQNGFAAMRMAHIAAGVPETTSLSMVNRQCASGLSACANIANSIAANQITVGVGAGVESMSCYPMNQIKAPKVDFKSYWDNKTAMDCLLPMGVTSENVAKKYHLQRHLLDEFAAASHQKAADAQDSGKFDHEIVPVGNITKDDGIRRQTTSTILAKLKPVFSPQGPTTAGNSSQTTDGAAAVLMMTRAEAKRRKLPILGIWRGYSTAGVPPSIMGIGPAIAIPQVLEQTGLTISDIDVFEINEAFASQASYCIQELGIDPTKVNPNGGAIALGHPLGCTGARMVATLLNELKRQKTARYGVISMCVGSGMGAAAVLEVEPQSKL
eukprot:CAMPEP_0198145752 /NCGR_PEP_ID=MMETSP1443-20131203/25147_1 /TAXON_ID=186043 /ORGANISM="Entomoneis sp., Strain CCMP2396" /LENGTH=397 /DNA_ID=CAMNT_0043809475 /DNA_START=65 /DNA_END=1258 /DNA_ORIENTATION=+